MSLATYSTIPALLATRTPFKHGSCHAFTETNGNYVVFSYGTLIAGIMPDGSKHLNATKYSTTTSRLQNIIRKAWGL